ncbi:MAG TPA: hypothetical protein VFF24_16440, partial [Acidimicrobiia bacterium]|nr:hypothetical protein [Acidimicrobiia bacterium]
MLRGFFSSRAGIAVVVVTALAVAGAAAFALRGEENEPLPQAATELTTTTTVPPPAPVTGTVLLGASTSPDVRSPAAEKSAVEELERRLGRTIDI